MSSVLPPSARPLATPARGAPSAGAPPREAGGARDRHRDAYLVVRVGDERFALPLDSVAEGLESPRVLAVAGVGAHWLGLVEWRGRRIPLGGADAPFGREARRPCAVALILDDVEKPLALAVDELCDARVLPPSSARPFTGRRDPHAVVRCVAWDDDGLVAVVSPAAVREAMLAAAGPSPATLPTSAAATATAPAAARSGAAA